jgi:hypothetical protein
MRSELGDDYVKRLRKTYDGRVPGGADLVTYWFEKARAQIAAGKLQAAGLVSTNSIRGGANRKVLEQIVGTTRIFEAWSDQAWINEGAAVRVSLVGFGLIHAVDRGSRLDGAEVGEIHADLTSGEGTNLTAAKQLPENCATSFIGTQKSGAFDLPGDSARPWLNSPNPNGRPNSEVVRPWINGLDITRRPQDVWIVDFGDDTTQEDASLFETPFEYISCAVKNELLAKHASWQALGKNTQHLDKQIKHWWLFWCTRPEMPRSIATLNRYIATARVAKHRLFVWQTRCVIPDSQVVVIARSDDTTFGILHSRFHELWSLRLCTYLGVGNDPRYTPTTTFETFPFPEHLTPRDTVGWGRVGPISEAQPHEGQPAPNPPCARTEAPENHPVKHHADAIAAAAIKLNQLRETWLNPPEWVDWQITAEEEKAGFPKRPVAKPGHEADLKKRTLTNLYNARPAWLKLAHQQLDQAVAAAYGWTDYTVDLPDEEILRRLLALNLERSGMKHVK